MELRYTVRADMQFTLYTPQCTEFLITVHRRTWVTKLNGKMKLNNFLAKRSNAYVAEKHRHSPARQRPCAFQRHLREYFGTALRRFPCQ